jgi:hypothetical protein
MPQEDPFQGCDNEEVMRRRRFQAIFFLEAARRRIRWARMGISGSALTDREKKVLGLMKKEVVAMLVQGKEIYDW